MGARKLIDIRRQAEKSVAGMPDGDLKVKAFEVILNHLLHAQAHTRNADKTSSDAGVPPEKKQTSKGLGTPTSRSERIRSLKDEDYFRELRTMGDVRRELASRGWHYPATALSGPLQELVQRRELRRQKMPEGKKIVWKYSDP